MLDLLLILGGMLAVILLNDCYYKWKQKRKCQKNSCGMDDFTDK